MSLITCDDAGKHASVLRRSAALRRSKERHLARFSKYMQSLAPSPGTIDKEYYVGKKVAIEKELLGLALPSSAVHLITLGKRTRGILGCT